MSTIQNENQNGNAGTTLEIEKPDPKDVKPDVLATMPLAELVARTFEDGSRIHNPKETAEAFEAFATATSEWVDNYRSGIKLSRRMAIAIYRLRRFVTNINGEPLWAVKNLTAWKVIYEDRVQSMFDSLEMDADEVKALKAAIKTYGADRYLINAVMAEYAVATTHGLGRVKWIIDPKAGTEVEVRTAIAALLGDDQKAASKYERLKFPDALVKAVEIERKRQVKTSGKDKGKAKQGFEKKITSIIPAEKKSGGGSGGGSSDAPDAPGNVGQATLKSHADAMRELLRSGSISVHSYVTFQRELMAELNAYMIAKAVPKGGNKPGIVKMLDDMGIESRFLADWYRPGDDKKPTKDEVASHAVEIATA